MKTVLEIVKYLLIVYNIILMYGTIRTRDKNSLTIFLLSAVTVAYLIIK